MIALVFSINVELILALVYKQFNCCSGAWFTGKLDSSLKIDLNKFQNVTLFFLCLFEATLFKHEPATFDLKTSCVTEKKEGLTSVLKQQKTQLAEFVFCEALKFVWKHTNEM